ncbi:hypothetical protein L6654_32925 [Bradyrhizobium sp. WYCCWR 13023]|uniref:Uncharacterized protein n=1 Tax=Bradyrhizobium zhengyangense TaxID=2911009 RepID=A0A9X1REZ0_9BRAD|nr:MULTISPECIES: hypothetical protein [Bradyrhizobium]MCG2631444.1 hypothetical protein [Bradyrhizobium zhengyangense]MCG2639427.1 hypothetical protein [Bradyrhizobium zhengyangense]MCG2669499.1 hypothetical protein [Bradyrhizobium zhengyangense]MDA9525682.1 hypothetical protein [Bradyrhizobium sp. CCBAU 11434]
MRKIILVAAMVLVSASAQAGGARSLSLASANDQAPAPQGTVAPPANTTQVSEVAPVATAPTYVDRPTAVSTTAPAATTTTSTSSPAAAQPAPKTTKVDKPRHHKTWTEGRIISELHRHGIYW